MQHRVLTLAGPDIIQFLLYDFVAPLQLGLVGMGNGKFADQVQPHATGTDAGRARRDLKGDARGLSVRAIATRLSRASSTINRELKRNGGAAGYRAVTTDQEAWDKARRPKRCKLVGNRSLSRAVASKLRLQWSPQQIAGWLKRTYPQDESHQVSHETIYKSLFIQARGALKRELQQHLRTQRDTPLKARWHEERRAWTNTEYGVHS